MSHHTTFWRRVRATEAARRPPPDCHAACYFNPKLGAHGRIWHHMSCPNAFHQRRAERERYRQDQEDKAMREIVTQEFASWEIGQEYSRDEVWP